MRKRLPTTRKSTTHRFEILARDEPIKGYITIGLFPDGTPAEMFLVLARVGESLRGLARCWATCFSICLQMGVPLDQLVEKFKYFRFEPAGWTENPQIPYAHSIADYVCRWIEITFLGKSDPLPGNTGGTGAPQESKHG